MLIGVHSKPSDDEVGTFKPSAPTIVLPFSELAGSDALQQWVAPVEHSPEAYEGMAETEPMTATTRVAAVAKNCMASE